jgi:hypothetical protein
MHMTDTQRLTDEIAALDLRIPELQAEHTALDAQVIELQRQATAGDTKAQQQLKDGRQRRALINLEVDDLIKAKAAAVQDLANAKEADRLAGARKQLPRILDALAGLDALNERLADALREVAQVEAKFEELDALGHSVMFNCKHQHGVTLTYNGTGPRAKPHLYQSDVINAGVRYLNSPTRVVIREGAKGTIYGFQTSLERLRDELLQATGGAA